MSSRSCIYTGLKASTTDKVIPKTGGDETHNWANSAPCSKMYKDIKARRLPNELEMNANRLHTKLELAKLDVQFYEAQLLKNQAEIRKVLGISDKNTVSSEEKSPRQVKEEKIAIKEKEIIETNLETVLEERKKKKKGMFY